MFDLALATGAVTAATSAVGLIDKIWDEVERFTSRHSENDLPREHRQKIQKEGDAIVSRVHGQVQQTITAKDLEKLPESDLRHIKVLEQSMENHYAIWASVYPQLALAVDPIAKAKTELQLKEVVGGMKKDLNGVLDFLAKSGLYLDDHYLHIRSVVGELAVAA